MADEGEESAISTSENVNIANSKSKPDDSNGNNAENMKTEDQSRISNREEFKLPDKITFSLPKSKSRKTNHNNADENLSSGDNVASADDNVAISTPATTTPEENVSKKCEEQSISKTTAPVLRPLANKKYDFPAQKLSESTIPYKEPSWGGACEQPYSFEVLKNGTILDTIDLTTKSFYVFGRLPSCDVAMDHPSLSRHHAVVQYCTQRADKQECGWYLYDLDSTHGTWLNKTKITPNVYHRLRVGFVVKFGGSTRLHILQGPSSDTEEESELTITEMKQQRERQKREVEVLKLAEMEAQEKTLAEQEKLRQETGCTWGIDDDAMDESMENPFATLPAPENEELYIDDPKKSLKGYFEREGYDLPEYEISDAGFGKYRCQVELPIDTVTGQPMIVEVTVSGKKKEAVLACALEACRILDRHGLLRNSTHESRKRKLKNWEDDDFYDSDEDTFLDRTGTIEKKRQMRMKKAGKKHGKVQTYDNLIGQHTEVVKELEEIEAKLDKAKRDAEAAASDDVDALDAYMMAIKSGAMDTKTKMKLKCRQLELRKDEQKLRKLVNIAKPASLPELVNPTPARSKPTDQKGLPMIGKKRAFDVHKPAKWPIPVVTQQPALNEDDDNMVVEEDDDDEEMGSNSAVSEGNKDMSRVKGPSLLPPQSVQQDANVKGPTLPPPVQAADNTSKEDTIQPTGSTKSFLQRTASNDQTGKKKKSLAAKADYDASDPDYAVWMPPTGQSGDGKTHLNDKYGY